MKSRVTLDQPQPAPPSDEARDVPPVSVDMLYPLLALLAVVGIAIGTALGSWVLHVFDAEIRAALAWAWQQLGALYWAWARIHG